MLNSYYKNYCNKVYMYCRVYERVSVVVCDRAKRSMGLKSVALQYQGRFEIKASNNETA